MISSPEHRLPHFPISPFILSELFLNSKELKFRNQNFRTVHRSWSFDSDLSLLAIRHNNFWQFHRNCSKINEIRERFSMLCSKRFPHQFNFSSISHIFFLSIRLSSCVPLDSLSFFQWFCFKSPKKSSTFWFFIIPSVPLFFSDFSVSYTTYTKFVLGFLGVLCSVS